MAESSVFPLDAKGQRLGEYRRRKAPAGRKPPDPSRNRPGRAASRPPGGKGAPAAAAASAGAPLPWVDGLGWAAHQWGWPALLGGLAGLAKLPGDAFPLAAGYVVALVALGDRRRGLAATVGSLGAMAVSAGPLRWVEQLLIVLLVWFFAALTKGDAPHRPQGGRPGAGGAAGRVWRLPLLVLAGTVFLRLGMLYVAGAGTEAMLWATGESLLELGAAFVLMPAAALHRHRPARLEFPHVAGLVVAWAGLAWVLAPVRFYGVDWAQLCILTGILGLALGGGAALAAPAGAGLGALVAAAGGGVEFVGFAALAALGAGLGYPWGKPGVAAGLVLSQAAIPLLGFPVDGLYPGFLHAVAAASFLAILPRRLLDRWLDWVGVGVGVGMAPEETAEEPRDRGQEPGREEAPPGLGPGYLRRLSLVFDELANAFGQAGAAAAPAGPGQEAGPDREGGDAMGLFVEGVTERICGGCSAFQFCWEENPYHTYQALVELARGAEQAGRLALEDLPETLKAHCVQQRNLLRAAADTFQLVKLHQAWERRFNQSRELVPQQLRGVARLVRDLAAEVERAGTGPWKPWLSPDGKAVALEGIIADGVVGNGVVVAHGGRPVWLRVDTAVVKRAKDGSVVSGDSEGRIELGPHRVALVLSDGMGAGEAAARESQAVVRVLRRLLEAGFDEHFAVRMVNAVLLLRSPEETFATIDLAVINLRDQAVDFLKVGAPPTLVVRRAEGGRPRVELVRGASVPAGILQQVDVEPQRCPLRPGDLLLMLTDGFLEGMGDPDGSESRLAQWLHELEEEEPAALARHLLARLEARALKDDVTLLAARLEAAEPPVAEPRDVGVYRRQRG